LKTRTKGKTTATMIIAASMLSFSLGALAQHGVTDGQWPTYGGDAGSTKYTSLSQINADNFERLGIAWRWQSLDGALDLTNVGQEVSFGRMQGTPLMVEGVLYMITSLNQVAAIDAVTGTTLWSFNPQIYLSGAPVGALGFHQRGVAYWSDGQNKRVLVATQDGYLFSLNAEDGAIDTAFGNGQVDMTDGIPRAVRGELDWQGAPPLGAVSPPIVVGDILVVSQITSNRPRYKERPPLWIRGYDIRTGAVAWTFHTIPLEGEFGNDTWEDDSWRTAGNTGVWSMMSADLELGYVYLPMEAATDDFYGGHRPGDNLFSESIVALDARTGERVWHYQTVHHGVWDLDNPAAPNLLDITVDGRVIKAVAQVTKQGFTYVLDRVTGEPVWPINETPVPQGGALPGERLVAHPAHSEQTAGLCAPGHEAGFSDRLHPGTAGRGRGNPERVHLGAAVHAAVRDHPGGQSRHTHAAGCRRRCQLAGGRRGSAEQHSVRAFLGQPECAAHHNAGPERIQLQLRAPVQPVRTRAPRAASAEAALCHDHRVRHEQRRDPLAGGQWR
jgi:quinoprotein glucose dehydrogenase